MLPHVAPPSDVSIHAPSEGSDVYFCAVLGDCGVSIHAPSEGSDYALHAHAIGNGGFNPRSQ